MKRKHSKAKLERPLRARPLRPSIRPRSLLPTVAMLAGLLAAWPATARAAATEDGGSASVGDAGDGGVSASTDDAECPDAGEDAGDAATKFCPPDPNGYQLDGIPAMPMPTVHKGCGCGGGSGDDETNTALASGVATLSLVLRKRRSRGPASRR